VKEQRRLFFCLSAIRIRIILDFPGKCVILIEEDKQGCYFSYRESCDRILNEQCRWQYDTTDSLKLLVSREFLVCTLETANHADCPDCIREPFARRILLRSIIILALRDQDSRTSRVHCTTLFHPSTRGLSVVLDSLTILCANRTNGVILFDTPKFTIHLRLWI